MVREDLLKDMTKDKYKWNKGVICTKKERTLQGEGKADGKTGAGRGSPSVARVTDCSYEEEWQEMKKAVKGDCVGLRSRGGD